MEEIDLIITNNINLIATSEVLTDKYESKVFTDTEKNMLLHIKELNGALTINMLIFNALKEQNKFNI